MISKKKIDLGKKILPTFPQWQDIQDKMLRFTSEENKKRRKSHPPNLTAVSF